jgi:hypothetical protein
MPIKYKNLVKKSAHRSDLEALVGKYGCKSKNCCADYGGGGKEKFFVLGFDPMPR